MPAHASLHMGCHSGVYPTGRLKNDDPGIGISISGASYAQPDLPDGAWLL